MDYMVEDKIGKGKVGQGKRGIALSGCNGWIENAY